MLQPFKNFLYLCSVQLRYLVEYEVSEYKEGIGSMAKFATIV